MAFLQHFAEVVSSAQIAISQWLDYLLRSSGVISNLPIFTPSGDTTGDTNLCYDSANQNPGRLNQSRGSTDFSAPKVIFRVPTNE